MLQWLSKKFSKPSTQTPPKSSVGEFRIFQYGSKTFYVQRKFKSSWLSLDYTGEIGGGYIKSYSSFDQAKQKLDFFVTEVDSYKLREWKRKQDLRNNTAVYYPPEFERRQQ